MTRDGNPETFDELLAWAEEHGIECSDLDENVHDAKSAEAADINNSGLDAQLEYLLYTPEGDQPSPQVVDDMRKVLQRMLDEKEPTVACKFCGKWVPAKTAHLHDGAWVGDECCWDERLRSSE